jgi:hypothetical protein
MDESEAFAIATQQAHALGKAPKGYGTTEGRAEAHRKYRTPQDDQKTASAYMWDAFFSEIEKLAVFRPAKGGVAALGAMGKPLGAMVKPPAFRAPSDAGVFAKMTRTAPLNSTGIKGAPNPTHRVAQGGVAATTAVPTGVKSPFGAAAGAPTGMSPPGVTTSSTIKPSGPSSGGGYTA